MSEYLNSLVKDLEDGGELVFRLTANGIGVAMEKCSVVGMLDVNGNTAVTSNYKGRSGAGIVCREGCEGKDPDCAHCDRLPEDVRERMQDGEYTPDEELCDAAYVLAQMVAAVEKMAQNTLKMSSSDVVRKAVDTFSEMVKEAYCDWCGEAFAMAMFNIAKDGVTATSSDD